ncbi:MAG: STAS domain-containing protein [Acidimicrobiia bacterium]
MENRKSNLTEAEAAGIADLIEISRSHRKELMAHRRQMVERFHPSLLRSDQEMEAESEEGLQMLEAAVASGDLSSYLASMREQTVLMADEGLEFKVIGEALVDLITPVADLIETDYSDDLPRALRTLRALHLLESEFLLAAGGAYATVREDSVESEYQQVIRRLSTPVIDVWDEVLVMPLIGVLDSTRAQQMMEQLLERIAAQEARFVIIDITGVPTVDTAVAEHLLKTTKASRLVGAQTLLAGISPRVAQTLVRLGVSLGDVSTFPNLRSGLEHALRALGYSLQRGD